MLAPVFIMIYAEVIFWSNDIKDLNVVLPFPPSIGESIEFPIGTVKYYNGAELEDRCFKISNIDWVFTENSMIPKYKFSKLSIYVERP
jgi:hypothetical protein